MVLVSLCDQPDLRRLLRRAHLGHKCADIGTGPLYSFLASGSRTDGAIRYVLSGIDLVRDGYAAIVKRLVRVRCWASSHSPMLWWVRDGCSRSRPPAFFRPRTKPPFSARPSCPRGASVKRTDAVAKQVEEIIRRTHGLPASPPLSATACSTARSTRHCVPDHCPGTIPPSKGTSSLRQGADRRAQTRVSRLRCTECAPETTGCPSR